MNDLGEIKQRRAALVGTCSALEAALSAPVASSGWPERLGNAVTALRATFDEHVTETEGSGGTIEQLRERAPRLSDRIDHRKLLAAGLVVLVAADLVLASAAGWRLLLAGVALWGVHMGMTQGLLAAMVADTAPEDLRGTAYGFFNLLAGVALLVSSAVAGLLWDGLGSAFTFYAGAAFAVLTLLGLLAIRPRGVSAAASAR